MRLSYLLRRLLYMVVLLFVISVFSFIVIQLPPGDYLTSYIMTLQTQQGTVDESMIEALRKQYGLDLPMYDQYIFWIKNMFKGDFGWSFEWKQPVGKLLADRLPMTVLLSILTLIFTYVIAVPIGIYSATHQYSFGDFFFTIIGFVGLATPSFFLALVLMFLFNKYLGFSVGGIFSTQYIDAPWSFAKFMDLLKHLPIPIFVIGLAGTASIIRVMRGCLLDELRQQYVITARAKGLSERKLLYKYPVRVAMNPIISTIGWVLPGIVSGATITAIVLDIPTVGNLLYSALLSQDTYLAGSSIMILAFLTIIGTFISDLLLAWADPRIQYQ
ncbi:TPA: ABC transporter permease [bacterium]|nr:ABC transporter permease [bacterium]